MSGSDLDSFMLACSDLNQPARSRLFQNRPGLKDIKVQPRPAAPSAAFQTSQKARDWSQLDLGDAFSQAAPSLGPSLPLSAPQASDADWDEFAEFQSCPPPVAASGSVDLLSGQSPAGGGLVTAGSSSSVNLLSGQSPSGGGLVTAGASGSVDLLNGQSPAGGGLAVPGAAASAGFPPLFGHHGVLPDHHTAQPAPNAATVRSAAQNGPFGPGAAPSPGLGVNWSMPVESVPVSAPAPAAGYVPVSAVLPAAKPTRFRQGLVPLPAEPEEEFSEFVTAEPTAGGRQAGSGQRLSDATVAAVAAEPNLFWLDAPLAPTAGLAPPLSSPPNRLTPASAPAPALAQVNFPSSLGAPVDDFSSPIAPPPGSGPPEVEVCAPPAWPPSGDDEDFGEFVSVEQPAAGGISSRHGSLPSLDLQVAASSDGGEVSPLDMQGAAAADSGHVSPLEPDRRDAATAVKHDKYDSFRQEIMTRPSSESALVSDWRRCLQACYELIQEGVALFGSVADLHTCSEVAGSPQGASYIDNLSRVFRVAGRIEQASEQHGCRHQLDYILSETCKAWANLTAFVSNSPTRAAVVDGWSPEAAQPPAADPTPSCGVCLLPAPEAAREEPTLTCAGRPYHACCANLWVNRVADVLPALQP